MQIIGGGHGPPCPPIPTALQYQRTVMPAKSNSDVMFCLQSYQELIIDRSLVY